ncbi:hypothetical protein C362_02762 [Cryptococcus neoformans Bt1]|nr:hypothetical protein C362_02762 [Cryptococcus neoformans var. grubii Bt1]OXG26085.1 hypothetical protein C367_03060 [Cryptococcus neoformans var. grubii Ze90-1]
MREYPAGNALACLATSHQPCALYHHLQRGHLWSVNERSSRISPNIYCMHAYFGSYWGNSRIIWICTELIIPNTSKIRAVTSRNFIKHIPHTF